MTFGAEIWGPPLIQAAGSVASGVLGGMNSGQETKMQRTQRKLVDKLISSLSGNGPYSDLFNADQDVFQKSFVEPAQSMFRNQIAPQIQQQSIAGGQQRGTGLDDQLLRAGVDLDSMLNSHMADFQQQAMNRKQNTISSILGGGSGGTQDMGAGQAFGSAGAGYLSSKDFTNSISNIFGKPSPQQAPPPRKGFENQASYAAQAPYMWGQ